MRTTPRPLTLVATHLLTMLIGCSPAPDERAQRIADESLQRQKEQNQLIAEQTKQATEAAAALLEADKATRQEIAQAHAELMAAEARSRTELLAMQDKVLERDAEGRAELNQLTADTQAALQSQRETVDHERAALEAERREIAQERQRAPVIAAAITQLGLILACLSPLLLAGYVLFVMRRGGDEEEQEVVRLLIDQVVTEDRPQLMASHRTKSLPAPDDSDADTKERQ